MWKYFFLGLLAGWLIEWIIDWLYWRRRPARGVDESPGVRSALARAADGRPQMHEPGTSRAAAVAGSTGAQAEGIGTARPAVESNVGTTTSADTPAGRVGSEAALGTEGAVSTSSATLTSTAPVYRQEDLEAIDGIDPKLGALLRSNGISTFGQLAVTRIDELARIVEDAGRQPPASGIDTWIVQARLAAAGNWAGMARMQKEARTQNQASADTLSPGGA